LMVLTEDTVEIAAAEKDCARAPFPRDRWLLAEVQAVVGDLRKCSDPAHAPLAPSSVDAAVPRTAFATRQFTARKEVEGHGRSAHELEFVHLGEYSRLGSAIEQEAHGLPAFLTVVEGVVVDVHAHELVG